MFKLSLDAPFPDCAVLAKGVESEAQAGWLKSLACPCLLRGLSDKAVVSAEYQAPWGRLR